MEDRIKTRISPLKRVLSIILAFSLVVISSRFELLGEVFSFDLRAIAADINPDGGTTNQYTIQSPAQLVTYSDAYRNYPANHQEDILIIAFSGSSDFTNYKSIGTSVYPFKGELRINSTSNAAFIIDRALFDYVYDSARIVTSGLDTDREIVYTRISSANNLYESILANHVVHDDAEGSVPATWKIQLLDFEANFPNVIGEMGESASVNLELTNNAFETDPETGTNFYAQIDAVGNAGLLCGTMGTSSVLNAVINDGLNIGYNISATGGHAGGLAGEMNDGSVLNVTVSSNPQAVSSGSPATIKTGKSGGYAGGLVGNNNGGTVNLTLSGDTTSYSVSEVITGGNGVGAAGGLYGYYKTPSGEGEHLLDISQYEINCNLNLLSSGTGYVGSVFGILENGGTLTVGDETAAVTTVKSVHNVKGVGDTESKVALGYGSLAGYYKADDAADTLKICNVNTEGDNVLGATKYSGAIAEVAGASYVEFEGFNVKKSANVALSTTYGGLVAEAKNGYIYAKDVTVGSQTAITGFNGGALIGLLGDGVLGMDGNINIKNARPAVNEDNGKFVRSRDNALIYADSSWNPTMSTDELDNVGTWGDVIFFDGTRLSREDVFDAVNDHVITLKSVDTSDISSVSDFALASVLYQINPEKNNFLDGPTQLADNVALSFTDDIDLIGTGLRGITRDNGARPYKGSATGASGKSLVLDIKNIKDGPVYRHLNLGLFGKTDGATISDLTIGGNISVKCSRDKVFYVGGAVGEAVGDLTVNDCNTVEYDETAGSGLNITVDGGFKVCCGRLIGGNNGASGAISVSGGIIDGTITGGVSKDEAYFGGVVGYIGAPPSNSVWNFSDIVIKGTVESTVSKANQRIGGLVAGIDGGKKATVNLDGITYDGFVLEGTATDSQGGLLGYSWTGADVNVIDVSVYKDEDSDDTNDLDESTVKVSGAGHAAGLVYRATGHWEVTGLDLRDIKVDAASSASVGMIVNKGKASSDGIYLVLPAGYDYKLSFASGSDVSTSTSNHQFDEICAYSAGIGEIMNNKQGVVSVSTAGGLVMSGSSDSLTYKPQTTEGTNYNPNTRYYYNLDTMDKREGNDISSTPAMQLMNWGLYRYASDNIRGNFTDNNINQGLTYELQGYSWYPVTLDSAATISGIFKFYNHEFEICEEEAGSAAGGVQWSSLSGTQHYMMHNGLLYDVTKSLTLGKVTLQGTVGAVGTNGTGALIYGTVSGSASSTTSITVNRSSGSVILDGIRIWNYQDVSSSYAPLLINSTGSYVALNINNVSTTAAYVNDGVTTESATSLIGKVGKNDSDVVVSADFKNIKLDARTSAGSPDLTAYGYNTTKSIFTKATLLEQLLGTSGTYTYTFDDDWGSGNHNVTFGKEVGYTLENNANTQYPDQEHWYARASADDTQYATQYTLPPSGANYSDSFDGFLKYVYNASTDGTQKYGQLKVNHQPTDVLEGCGTYNDPYIIKKASDLVRLSKWLSGSDLETATINALFGDTWCDNKTEHATYNGSSSGFTNAANGSDTRSLDQMRRYLAGAYYIIDPTEGNTIVLDADSGFMGLGAKEDGFRFRGVIIGNDKTIENKSTNAFINYSDGSVIRNLTIKVDADIVLGNATECYDYITGLIGSSTTNYITGSGNKGNTNAGAYGAVISVVAGGDNIIDKVQVVFEEGATIKTSANKAQYQPVGGYIGVVVNGGVIFKNMTGAISGLNSSNVITDAAGKNNNQSPADSRSDMASDTNFAWLYVNPIIGRVVNGFAVTEAAEYHPREADCTMKNGTKHYSITDIKDYSLLSSTGKLSINNSKDISIPDSQSFYIVSLIVNSGMGVMGYKANTKFGSRTGYYNSDKYQTVRRSEYDTVGQNGLTQTDVSYINSTKDSYDTSSNDAARDYVPYIIANYTNTYTEGGVAYYFAKQIAAAYKDGNNKDVVNTSKVTLSNVTYDLPDGFKGIGSFYITDHLLRVTNFEGNGAVISQNTSYNYYYSGNGANKYTDFDTKYKNVDDVGLGLFNIQDGTTNNASSSRYYNFIMTGNIGTECYDNKTGKKIDYVADVTSANPNGGSCIDMPKMVSVGSLIGVSKKEQYIDSVALQNISVKGIRNTGGMIGWIPGSKTTIMNTKNSDATPNASYGIKVHGGGNTGGVIGRSYNGNIIIDNGNATYSIEEVVSDCKARTGDTGDYNYGVGGFVGNCRANRSSKNGVTIQNVIVGMENQDALTYVKSATAEINAGGMIGIVNRCTLNLSNCKIYNQAVSSKYFAAGLVGYFASTEYDSVISNVLIFCKDDLDGIINSDNQAAGGFIGAGKRDLKSITINDSSISGYTISGKDYSGGCVGLWAHNIETASNDNKLIIYNVKVMNSDIIANAANSYSGGVIGYLNYVNDSKKKELYGYNILAKDLVITGNTRGYLCGGVANSTYNIIKIAAFSRQETLGEGETSSMAPAIIGSGSYGVNGYVVFADYDGICDTNNKGTAFTNGIGSPTNVDAADPYVNTSPYISIRRTGDNGTPILLTGDGISETARVNILNDIRSGSAAAPKAYSYVGDTENNTSAYNSYYAEGVTSLSGAFTTLSEELGGDFPDLPMLIIETNNKYSATRKINAYINMLANTRGYTYNNNRDEGNTDRSSVFTTDLYSCTYDASGVLTATKISNGANNTGLRRDGSGYFYMDSKAADSSVVTGQFSLIDVQFKNPSATGSTAYHLYVPIYTRKLMEYDFLISLDASTDYITEWYEDHRENVVLENLGSPVTAEFEFVYAYSLEDWNNLLNDGENLNRNFNKTMTFRQDGAAFESANTMMVLVDKNDSGRAYYLDNLDVSGAFTRVGSSTSYSLDLSKFKALDGTSFEPLEFDRLFTVTAIEDNAGSFVAVTDGTETVRANAGVIGKYKYLSEEEIGSNNSQKYSLAITFADEGDTNLSEKYYLSIFTPDYDSDQIAMHYNISAPNSFNVAAYPSKANVVQAADLLQGMFYENTVDTRALTSNLLIDASTENNNVRAEVTANVSLYPSAHIVLDDYLSNPDIHIYQSILLAMNKKSSATQSDVGIKQFDNFKINSYTVTPQGRTSININKGFSTTANRIELPNEVDLAGYLKNSAIEIKANVTFTYTDQTHVMDQFPVNANGAQDIGTTVIGYSNIATDKSKTAYSKVSVPDEDTTKAYYCTTTQDAVLNYIADEAVDECLYYGLGINANELEIGEPPVVIDTLANYDLSKIGSAANGADYITGRIQLFSMVDGYQNSIDMTSYISKIDLDLRSETITLYDLAEADNINTKGLAQIGGTLSNISLSNDGTILTFTVPKSAFDYSENTYSFGLHYDVLTGTAFEKAGLTYSNYKIDLMTSITTSDGTSPVNGSPATDYIKYTNVRMYTDIVPVQ